MKKTIYLALGLICAGVLGSGNVLAADNTKYPVTAKSDATVTLTADDGSGGEGGGETTGPGGGEEGGGEEGGGGGTIVPPGPGEGGEGGIVDPGQKSPLRLSLLTAFNFGEIKINANGGTYYAELPTPTFEPGGPQERPNFIQVTDNRGNNKGWNLTAKMVQPFTNNTDKKVLTGAEINLNNAWTQPQESALAQYRPTVFNTKISTSNASLIASAPEKTGMGTWNILYGTLYAPDQEKLGDASKSVSLTIPAGLEMSEGTYTAKVEWTLNNVPAAQ